MSNQLPALVRIICEIKAIQPPPASAFSGREEKPLLALALLNLIPEEEAINLVADRLAIPALNLNSPADKPKPMPELLSKLDPSQLWKHKAIPVREDGAGLLCAFADPLDRDIIKLIQFATGRPVHVAIARELDIAKHLSQTYLSIVPENGNEQKNGKSSKTLQSGETQSSDLSLSEANLPPIVKFCNKILADAVAEGASDIHVEPTESCLEVRYRIDGVMVPAADAAKELLPHIISRLKILAGMDISEKRRPQDGRMKIHVSGEAVDIRVSSIPTASGEKLVFRLLRSNATLHDLNKLGIPHKSLERLNSALSATQKLVVVTGPTGSGKTTTLYACLQKVRDGSSNILTVEDPIEYRIPGINQTQINEDIGVTFASVLRTALRQDPDVIMVGEIRDPETAGIALQAAQTGHQVLSTLHTNDAPGAITRLLHLAVDPYILSTSLSTIIAQRLVRRVCPDCAAPAPKEYLNKYSNLIKAHGVDPRSLRVGAGCAKCRDTGYRGRLGLYSILEINDEIAELIHKRSSTGAIVSEARRHGFMDLGEVSISKVISGETTFDEVSSLLGTSEPANLESRVHSGELKGTSHKISPNLESGIKKRRILLVEDDPNLRAVISILLENEMFEVTQAENGLDALKKVYEGRPEIILCDLMMPVMDGKEFLVKMRANQETRSIPIIILTAVNTEENEVGLLDLGARDFVSKTSPSPVILSRIRKALQLEQ